MGAQATPRTSRCTPFVACVALAVLGGCGLVPPKPSEVGGVDGADVALNERECRGNDKHLLDRVPLRTDGLPPRTCRETLEFYKSFAAMAAVVYDARDRVDEQLGVVAGSSWLMKELSGIADKTSRSDLLDQLLDKEKRSTLYVGRIGRKCANDQKTKWTAMAHDGAVRAAQGGCREFAPDSPKPTPLFDLSFNVGTPHDLQEANVVDENGPDEHSDSGVNVVNREPESWQQCDFNGDNHQAVVPLRAMTEGWEPVPELQRRLHPHGWTMFVPGLVIDLWRRGRGAQGESPVIEYALVFRGTADGGGWISNFRGLTAFTPYVWDQYRQAATATTDLVNQIYQLHALSDALFEREVDTRIKITAVGHSLGGGLAQYVFLRVPQVTRVVAFDPSPINGASSFSPDPVDKQGKARGRRDRASVMNNRHQPLDREEAYDGQASMFVLFEQGEALTSLAGCTSGPIWGAEGGPHVRCDSVNLSGGSAVRQHNMPQLACKMNLALRGLPTRP